MAKDALLVLQAVATQTASTSSSGLDLKAGTPKRGLVATFKVHSVGGTSPTAQFKIQHSDDNTTFTDLSYSTTLTAAGQVDVTFESPKRYFRAASVIGGSSPVIVWDGYLATGKSTVN